VSNSATGTILGEGSAGTLLVLVLGTLMVAVDTTVVLLALPTITGDLHSNLSIVIWTLLIYLLITSILATQLGRVGDIFGRKKIYNSGFAVFTAGSALSGFSPSALSLIIFRAIQALGGAMMISTSGAIVADNFPRQTRGRAFGYTSLGWNVGATLGIVLGGVITTFLGWRYIFYLNVPIGLVAVALGVTKIRPSEKVNAKLDLPGLVLLGVSLALFTYGAIDLASNGPGYGNVALISVGLALLVPLVYVERVSRHPMIDFSAFKERVLAYALTSTFMQSTGYLAIVFMVIMYLQGIRGLNPLDASLILVPGYVLSSLISPFMGRLSDKVGSRILATVGMGLMAASAGIYLSLGVDTSYYVVIAASLVAGVGSSMFYPANNSAIMANAPVKQYGSISGLARTLGNVGTLISYVIAITVASAAVPRYVAFEVFLGTSNLIGGLSQSFLVGMRSAFLVGAAILIVGTVLSAMRGREVRAATTSPYSAPSDSATLK
jgi:EmrB/QacA subfamily drug resistance transporter